MAGKEKKAPWSSQQSALALGRSVLAEVGGSERGRESGLVLFCGSLQVFSKIFLGTTVRFSEGMDALGAKK